STWYQVHLIAPDLDVTGVSLPGVPAVIVGHNQNISWGITNLSFDVQDLYLENINLQTGQVEYKGKIEQSPAEREMIAVKGAAPVETFAFLTRHGPIFLSEGNQNFSLRWTAFAFLTRHGPIFLSEGNQNFSLRWTAADAEPYEFPFLEINRAKNWGQFN